MRSSRERKTLTNQPRKFRSDTIIAGIISEKSESSVAPSHSFCRCTTFWRGTGFQSGTLHPCDGSTAITMPRMLPGAKTTSPILATTQAVRPARVEDIRLCQQPLCRAWACDGHDILGIVE